MATTGRGMGWVAAVVAALAWGCGDDGADGPAGQAGGGAGLQAGHAAAGAGAGATGGAGSAGRAAAGTGGAAGSRPAAGTGAVAGGGAGGAGGGAGAAAGAGAGGRAGLGGAGGGGGQGGSAPPVLEDPCPDGPFGDPLPQNRTAQLIKNGFEFLEGPVWIASQGVLLFTDMHMGQANGSWPPATIVRLTPPNTTAPFIENIGANGLAITPAGKLLACTHDMQTLSLFDLTTKARETLPLTFEGKHFNAPNDATVRSDGTIYFTDPDWQLGGRDSETDTTGVYRVAPGGEVTQFETGLRNPNGIALSPDERTLYVGSQNDPVMAYALAADGTVGARSEFAGVSGTDGLAVDCAGNVYVTAGQVQVFDPDGESLGTITVAETPANVAFGGTDRRTLYITARSGLYAIQLNVPGYPY